VVGAVGSPGLQGAVIADGPGCPFKTATGMDCPFCGMTRATIALGRGDVHAALGFHPLAPLVLVGMLGLMALIVAGRGDVAMRGRRVYVILGVIAAVWVLRFVL
jgi:hypothetical protein